MGPNRRLTAPYPHFWLTIEGSFAGGEAFVSHSFLATALEGVNVSLLHFADAENSFGEGCAPPDSPFSPLPL